MHNFIELAKEEVPQLENALKKIDVFLNRAPEGCLKWQNKKGKENPFVSMPSYKTKEVDENNKPVYRDVCYPVTKEFREQLYGSILETYRLDMEKRQKEGRPMNRREQMQQEEKAKKKAK